MKKNPTIGEEVKRVFPEYFDYESMIKAAHDASKRVSAMTLEQRQALEKRARNRISGAPETLQGAERDEVTETAPDKEHKSMPMNITMKDIKELEASVQMWEKFKSMAEASSNPTASDSFLNQSNLHANKACEIWQRVLLSR